MLLKGLVALTVGALASAGVSFGGSAHVAPVMVTGVNANVTSQVVPASHHASSDHHMSSFTITATGAHRRLAAREPVTFYIGVMAPGSGVPPTMWIPSNSPAAAPYIAYASRMTNPWGRATIVLKGQTAQTMEMVAVNVGTFQGYNPTTKMAMAALDSWWTTPTSTPTATAYDTVTATPFMVKTSKAMEHIHVVTRHDGRPVAGITIHDFVKTMSAAPTEVTQTTGMHGETTLNIPVTAPATINVIKSANPTTSDPFSGGIMALAAVK